MATVSRPAPSPDPADILTTITLDCIPAGLPAVEAEPDETDVFFVQLDANDHFKPVRIYTDWDEASEDHQNHFTGPIERQPFTPLDTEDRFVFMDDYWSSEEGSQVPPKSLLDLPRDQEQENAWGPGDFLAWLRPAADAFDVVTKWNRKSVAEESKKTETMEHGTPNPRDRRPWGEATWHYVLEVGKPFIVERTEIELNGNGLGVARVFTEYPIRVVEPTAAQLAQHAIEQAAELKGGAT